jgi:mannitol-1-/sugar-/sorbitol-6-phosphatase
MTARTAMPERVTAVLFDLDGVLVDSTAVVERVWKAWAREHAIRADDVLAVAHGRIARDVVAIVAPRLDAEQQALQIARREARDCAGLAAIPGALECVEVARRRPWAVVTSGRCNLASGRLAAAGLPVPEVLVTADDVANGKPDPEPYQRACRELAIPAAECLVVEDSPAGIQAAKRAGMTVLAVTTTHRPSSLCHADHVFPTVHEITRHLRAAGL